MIVKGITIHNTGNEKTAKQLHQILINDKQMNLCHYLVDENDIANTWSVEECASHTGKGYDYGNRYTISIEICRSTSREDLYLKAQANAVKLIKELMEKYNLTTKNIYFHRDFDTKKKCPHRILDIYKTKQNFIKEVFENVN